MQNIKRLLTQGHVNDVRFSLLSEFRLLDKMGETDIPGASFDAFP